MSNYVELSNLAKIYPSPKGPAVIVKDFNLNIQKGEFVTLIGHSGCGKSTVLSMLAGLSDITGGGIILAEDGEGIQHLVGVTDQGKSYPLARNDLNDSEFTGPAFSADGKVLFANIQSPGHVFAITGPWARPSNSSA